MALYKVAGRTVAIHDREEWQIPSQAIKGPVPFPDLVHWFVVHWPGAAASWVPDKDVAAHLRWANASYLNDPNRGYSYGYGFVIGPNPINWSADPIRFDTWEVRGFDIRIASNNGDIGIYGQMRDPNFNGRSVSAQIMASTSHPATADQIEQARWLKAIADLVYGETLTTIPHRTSDATSCPQDWIASKVPYINTPPNPPVPPPPPPPPPPAGGTYTVVAGDGWFAIARKLNVSVTALLAANPPATLTTPLHPGDVLNIPGAAPSAPSSAMIGVLDMIPVARRSDGTVFYTLDFKKRVALPSLERWEAIVAAGAVDVSTGQRVTDAGAVKTIPDSDIIKLLGSD